MPLCGCENQTETNFIPMEIDVNLITDKDIETLTTQNIFFGHMSVGYNIIDGIENIRTASKRFSKIHMQELREGESANNPGLYHAKVGNNGFPKKKCDSFKTRLTEDRFGSKTNIAFFKFCYVDFRDNTDIIKIFNYYTETTNYLKKEFPNLTIVHVTVPLQIHSWGIQGMIENIIKGNLGNIRNGIGCFKRNLIKGDIANIKRNEFNEMLVNTYNNIDPIYDLAKVESTLPDGERVTFRHKGAVYFSLAKEYTSDGGHLNESGSFCAARELLTTLADIKK